MILGLVVIYLIIYFQNSLLVPLTVELVSLKLLFHRFLKLKDRFYFFLFINVFKLQFNAIMNLKQ